MELGDLILRKLNLGQFKLDVRATLSWRGVKSPGTQVICALSDTGLLLIVASGSLCIQTPTPPTPIHQALS